MLKVVLFCILHFFNFHLISSNEDFPEVTTLLGNVKGFWKTSLDGRKYAAFEGIPYAKPPVGNLRFEEPQAIDPWMGTWQANKTHICIQEGLFVNGVEGEEDCLYLNVYIPAEFLDSSQKLEVVVVIHGGGFMMGAAHILARSEFFMDRDIILVTINYRLGIFGFLSAEDNIIPGNKGLKDQTFALKWIKDNIGSFGGNPESVTLVGQSAGGASVHFHYLSPLSRGLFHRGISQSGTSLAPWAIKENPLEHAKKLATLVDCPDKSSEEMKECLKQIPALDLMKQLKNFSGYGILPFAPFAPIVEKSSDNPFIDKHPYELLKEGKVLDLPWITSHTADDGLLLSAMFWSNLEEINEKWADISAYLLDYNSTVPTRKREEVARIILDYYLAPGEGINKGNFKKLTQLFTDRYFAVSGELAAKLQAKANKSPVYYYLFNYGEGENQCVEFVLKSAEVKGVSHGEDSLYLQGFFYEKPFSKKDKLMKNAFHDMLYEFAITGKPSFDGSDTWKPTGHSELSYLHVIGPKNMKMETIQNLTPIDFWNRLGLLEGENVKVKDEL